LDHLGENEPHISVLAAFLGVGWDKIGSKKKLCYKVIEGHFLTSKSAVFWQTKRYFGLFSTRTEKGNILGFSGIDKNMETGKGACYGFIFPLSSDPRMPDIFDER